MKTFVRQVLLLAAAVACQAGLALAEDIHWISNGDPSLTLVGDAKVAQNEQAPCTSCGPTSCCGEESCGECGACGPCLGCDECPPYGIVGIFGFDSFKGVSDSSYSSNFGAVTGLNAAVPVPGLRDYGIGWQLGMTYGVYDFDGRINSVNDAQSQQQTFLTTGFYRKASGDQQLSFGLVYDWMFNNNWGALTNAQTMGQWRSQFEWAFSGSNAVGVYGCVRDRSSVQLHNGFPVTDRPVSQVNLFWHHKFESAADSYLWVGLPQRDRLNGDGSLGDWIIGANIQVPLTQRLALYGNAQYMHPSAAAGAYASMEADWNIGAGIVWYFGGNAVSHSINGKCWLPYMPVANNSTFLVDEYWNTPPG